MPESKLKKRTKSDDDDNDGGIDPKTIAKRKQEAEEKKKKRNELKKKKQAVLVDDPLNEDEDGGVVNNKSKVKPTKAKKKSSMPLCVRHHDDENEDDDGGVYKQKLAAAEKKKQAAKEKTKKKEQEKAIKNKVNSDHDGDGVSDSEINKPKKIIRKEETIEIDDEDEDGGRIVKTYDTVKTIMSSKRPVLHTEASIRKASDADVNDGNMKSLKHEKNITAITYDTISKLLIKPSIHLSDRQPKESTSEFHFEPISDDEDKSERSVTVNSSSTSSEITDENRIHLLRSSSYRKAMDASPPTVKKRSKIFASSINKQENGSDQLSDNDAADPVAEQTQS
ncbi:unnamed protein product [Adineta ricciae]|uniref:Uncharacterized protein n=1 Tax=Adineta ricciae TaxID=249248 RepID=A0A814BBS8_ADIRI|nr:unnamed protein product [Adineta ricciae]